MELKSEVGFRGNLGIRHIRRPGALAIWKRRVSNALHALQGAGVFYSQLTARHYIAAEDRWVDLGVICRRVVTTAYVNLLTDELQGSQAAHSTLKWHDSGTGTTAAAVGDTALETPCGESRDDGSQTEQAANIYKTVATHTYAGSFAITEHGVFSASTSGTLLDRHVFSAINVVSSDQIEFTYQLTCTAGG